LSIFNALEAWFYRKPSVLSNLEVKSLKTENLRGFVRDTSAGGDAVGVRGEHTFKDRLADCGK
jgi:hypothetical protein